MKELVKITERGGKRVVSARELYEFLGYDKSQWSRWYQKNIIENDFADENIDYQTFDIMSNGNPTKDFALSIDFAKELSMLTRNEKGKQARRYFIERDKELRNIEQGKLGSGRYDASRYILPGVHSPEAKMIGEHSIWTICLNDMLYYRLKDILNAIDIYEHKRKETSKDWFKSYIYWINDQTGTVLHRYIKEPGVLFLISKTRTTKDNPSAQQFLTSFTRQAEKNRPTKSLQKNIRHEETDGEIDLKEFLDVIINVRDDDARNYLYNLYKKLKG
jgi:phage anti-repressor protein